MRSLPVDRERMGKAGTGHPLRKQGEVRGPEASSWSPPAQGWGAWERWALNDPLLTEVSVAGHSGCWVLNELSTWLPAVLLRESVVLRTSCQPSRDAPYSIPSGCLAAGTAA